MPEVKEVNVLESMRYKKWQILYVDTKVSDEGYFFYPGSPLSNEYVYVGAGGATYFDGPDITKDVSKGAKGIPKKLLECYVWHLTKEGR